LQYFILYRNRECADQIFQCEQNVDTLFSVNDKLLV